MQYFPRQVKPKHYNDHEVNFRRLLTEYTAFESVLKETYNTSDFSKCVKQTNFYFFRLRSINVIS